MKIKKITLSLFTILSFALYATFLNKNGTLIYVNNQSLPVKKTKTIKPIVVPSISTYVPPPKPLGMYQDGSYTGNSADAYYGYIQVQAIIQNGKLADVVFLDHPQDRGTSIRINNYAMPVLRSEAIAAQNANVSTVSGATDSSRAFRESLALALAQAKI